MSRKRDRHNTRIPAIIDVVIVTAGRFDLLKKCLASVYEEAKSTPLNIYLVDNGSLLEDKLQNKGLFEYQADGSNVVQFQTKRLENNVGFPQGNNEGARMGKSPLIMFLSDDVELHKGAIEKVVRDFDDITIGAVGIKLIFPPGQGNAGRPAGKVQHVGMCLNIRAEPYHPLMGWSPDNPKTCVSRDVWAVTGACFTIRRNLFEKFGGFNPIYGRGCYEDMEMCMNVHSTGARIFLDAQAAAYHYTGATAEKRQEPFPLQNNMMIFRTKWMNTGAISYGRVSPVGSYLSEIEFW